jgi:hypothetical protein
MKKKKKWSREGRGKERWYRKRKDGEGGVEDEEGGGKMENEKGRISEWMGRGKVEEEGVGEELQEKGNRD